MVKRGVFLSILAMANAHWLILADSVNFDREIRPILSNKCFHCHGPGEEDRKAGLRLDVPDGPAGALTARDEYHIIEPGSVDNSELWYRVTTDDDNDVMPPSDSGKQRLSSQELDLVRQWIEDGAGYEGRWAFTPLQDVDAPEVADPRWNGNDIDRIVYASLQKKGLTPSPEADKRTLIRRLSFDLNGLPPTIQEIDEFLNDSSPDAYEALVERLLSRPAYGEHMARYWADLVRLADTNGMHKDFHREFSAYKEWIIRSFNENLPFDAFLRYQLAGDLYSKPTRDQLIASGFNRLHMIIDKGTALPEESLHKNVVDRVEAFGTTFLGLTVQCAQCHDHKYDPITRKDYYQLYAFFNNFAGEPETVRAPERGLQPPFINLTDEEQAEQLDDFDARENDANQRLDGLEETETWLASMEEIDANAIEAKDADDYRDVGFETTLTLDSEPTSAVARLIANTPVELFVNDASVGETYRPRQAAAANLLDALKVGENTIRIASKSGRPEVTFVLDYDISDESKRLSAGEDWKFLGTFEEPKEEDSDDAAEEADEATDGAKTRPEPSVQIIEDPDWKPTWVADVKSVEEYSILDEIQEIQRERKDYLQQVPGAMVMEERDPPRETHMLVGGAYDNPGEPVERDTPEFLPALPPKDEDERYSRMDLANWLVKPEHPLTARVAANRIWQQFFGVGLVKTSEDFGAQGEAPSHPELLDTIALDFMESGWDIKRLVRNIVTTSTYRQSSDASPEDYRKDPENRNLARGSRFRLDAEAYRDQVLAVSGRLNREFFGKSVKPPQPPGLWEMVSMTSENKTYRPDSGDKIYRRSFYTYWRRGMPPPQMTIMNAPSREFCVARRERTNTPLQALLLMNESEYFDAAKALARRVLEQTDDPRSGMALAYEMCTSHPPKSEHLSLMEDTLNEFKKLYLEDVELTESLTPEMEDAPHEERAQLAAWTLLSQGILNLEATKVRK